MGKIEITNLEINDFFTLQKTKDRFDLIISDPPYPFDNQNGSNRMKFESGTDNMYNRMTYADLEKCYAEMLALSNPAASCYIFTNRDGLFHTKDSMERVGWTFRNLLVWDKISMGLGYHWRNQAEYIVYCTNGPTKNYVTKLPNIFREKKPRGLSAKPQKIWQTILEQQAFQDCVVCDPFAGSDPLSQVLNNNPILMSKIGASRSNIYPIGAIDVKQIS